MMCESDLFCKIPFRRKKSTDSDELEDSINETSQTLLQDAHEVTTLVKSTDSWPQVNDKRLRPIMINRAIQTTIHIEPLMSHAEACQIIANQKEEYVEEPRRKNFIDEETIKEILDFILVYTFWTIERLIVVIPFDTKEREAQTMMQYNYKNNKIILDIEIQTKLTCEPRHSNSKLLVDYEATKSFIHNSLQEYFVKGLESRIIIDDLLDEIVAKGANLIKYPMIDQLSQTVVSYKTHEERDEDILRKLRISVVIDPLEASNIVAPLIDHLLRLTRNEVSRDAQRVSKDILVSSIRRAVSIGFELETILRQPKLKSMEQMFLQRRKKIIESMLKRKTADASTQTGLAGVPEVAKLKPKDVLCSVCPRESLCDLCAAVQEEDSRPKVDMKVLRTQDILLSYNPCYVVATISEEARNPHLQTVDTSTKKIERQTTAELPISQCVRAEEKRDVSDESVKVLVSPKRNIQTRVQRADSVSRWACIIDDALGKSWPVQDSTSNNTTSITPASSTTKSTKSCSSESSHSLQGVQTMEALQILKKTFCTRNICPVTHLAKSGDRRLLSENTCEEDKSCNIENCTLLYLDERRKRPN